MFCKYNLLYLSTHRNQSLPLPISHLENHTSQHINPDNPRKMQHALQAGLSVGLSATSGFHSSKPKEMPKDYVQSKELTPPSFVPRGVKEDPVIFKGKNQNVEASRIAIGAWSWGDKATWHWDPSELPAVKEAWQTCLKNGVNFIDTAQVYGSGESERICGELFKGLKREDYVIQTKWW